jgi:hypothetical protein
MLRLPEAQTKNRIPDDQHQPVENGKETKPEQESLSVPQPNGIHSNRSCAQRHDYGADNQEGYSGTHKQLLENLSGWVKEDVLSALHTHLARQAITALSVMEESA